MPGSSRIVLPSGCRSRAAARRSSAPSGRPTPTGRIRPARSRPRMNACVAGDVPVTPMTAASTVWRWRHFTHPEPPRPPAYRELRGFATMPSPRRAPRPSQSPLLRREWRAPAAALPARRRGLGGGLPDAGRRESSRDSKATSPASVTATSSPSSTTSGRPRAAWATSENAWVRSVPCRLHTPPEPVWIWHRQSWSPSCSPSRSGPPAGTSSRPALL